MERKLNFDQQRGDEFSKNAAGPISFPKLTGNALAWFALYVQVNHEREVLKRLAQKSIECFLPLLECWSKRQDRRKKVHLPLFPGYLFIHTILDNYTNLHILKTPGALNILRNSDGPLPIPACQIESLKAILSSPDGVSLHPYLTEGCQVEVVRGPMKGCVGILLRQNATRGRLVVSIDVIKKSASVELNIEDIEPLHDPLIRKAGHY